MYVKLLSTAFEPQISGVYSDRSTNCATTTAHSKTICPPNSKGHVGNDDLLASVSPQTVGNDDNLKTNNL